MTEMIYKLIKKELADDPSGVGYVDCKDDAEIAEKLNNPVRKMVQVEEVSQSPMNRILTGVAGAPNVVKAIDVTNAKLLVTEA